MASALRGGLRSNPNQPRLGRPGFGLMGFTVGPPSFLVEVGFEGGFGVSFASSSALGLFGVTRFDPGRFGVGFVLPGPFL